MPDILETVKSDDFVEYYVFLVDENGSPSNKLQDLHNKILTSVGPLIENYIWHKDEFNLSVVTDANSENIPPHLYGSVHYGDNIEDEWYIVHLLVKLSKLFPDIFIQVLDSDGEFLLIEAANYLLKWMKPETCSNEVFIHNKSIRISPNVIANKPKQSTSIAETIQTLHKIKEMSTVERNVTGCINKRVQKFNDDLNSLFHNARAYVPAKIAALLDAKPNLIAPAVTTFCQRDMIDMKACRKMENFPQQDMVLRRVTFTKFLYAMVSRQKIQPERRANWSMPPLNSPDYKEHHLGFKISCGFEILASRCSEKSKCDLRLNKKWNQYVEVLKRKGYFRDLLEGSKEYVELEKKARIYFLDNVGTDEPDNTITNFLQTIKYNVNKMKEEERQVPPSDDEKWMEISEEEFNKLLEERFEVKNVNVSNAPDILSSTINNFLNRASDIEGVEFKKHDSNYNAMDVDDGQQNGVEFDAGDFMSSVNKMLDVLKIENLDSNELSDSDDYDTEDGNEESIDEDATLKSYMDLMDKELQGSSLSKSFVKKSDTKSSTTETSNTVDVDMNALTNILKSYEEQFGGAGPAGNLLHTMGLKLNSAKQD